jgi:hypothetical protein
VNRSPAAWPLAIFFRSIARRLGRAACTVSREVACNGGRSRYRALRADDAAGKRARRPKPCKLAMHQRLRTLVEDRLAMKWSLEQIAGWLVRTYPDEAQVARVGMRPSTGRCSCASRGALRKELTCHLRIRPQRAPSQGSSWSQR